MEMEFDATKVVEEIVMQAKENQEEFIIETIRPYCENILQIKINKEELKQILLNGMKKQQPFINKPCISEGVCREDKINVLKKIRAEILDEAEYAYADFDKYKEDILHAEADELPDDDFRYGLERAIEIINKYKAESGDKE